MKLRLPLLFQLDVVLDALHQRRIMHLEVHTPMLPVRLLQHVQSLYESY